MDITFATMTLQTIHLGLGLLLRVYTVVSIYVGTGSLVQYEMKLFSK